MTQVKRLSSRSAPHPSEAKIHLRIQMYGPSSLLSLSILPTKKLTLSPPDADGKSAKEAFDAALDNIEAAAEVVLEKYHASLEQGDFERVEDPTHDFETVNRELWAQKEREGKGTYEEFLEKKREKEETEAASNKAKAKAIKGGR